MRQFQLKTPVAFIIFNRPDTTLRVFNEIAKARPPKLFLISDGGRQDRPTENDLVLQSREIVSHIDWPCEVFYNFSEQNLGCKRRIASGIDWVFSHVEEAIILEDDCLPHPTFFRFCEELLEHYRHDQRIVMVSGDNFQFGTQHGEGSYYFSSYTHIWGWATWKRAWEKFDVEMKSWPEFKNGHYLETIIYHKPTKNMFRTALDATYCGKIDTWDYQWLLTAWTNHMLSIMPNVNLVSNIGFDQRATHTKKANSLANMEVEEISFPLRHPKIISPNYSADDFTARNVFQKSPWKKLTSFLYEKFRQKNI